MISKKKREGGVPTRQEDHDQRTRRWGSRPKGQRSQLARSKSEEQGEEGGVGSFCKHKTTTNVMNWKGEVVATQMKINMMILGEGEGKSSCKDKMKTNMTNKKGERAKNSFKQKKNMDMTNNNGGSYCNKYEDKQDE